MGEETKPGSGAGSASLAPVAPATAPSAPGNVPAAVPAGVSVPAFGGNRGGKKRRDGLPPGSAAAAEADRRKERDRKKRERLERARLAEPAALPSALEGDGGPAAPAPGGGEPGVVAAPGPMEPVIPWDPETLRPLFEELTEVQEAGRVEKFRSLALKGGLPEGVAKEVAKDARYTPMFKRSVIHTGPKATAKTLNRLLPGTGKFSDESIFALALFANFLQGRRLAQRLEKLIRDAKAEKAKEDSKDFGRV